MVPIKEYIKPYYKIFKKIGFNPNTPQKTILDNYKKENKLILNCQRNSGLTTILTVFSLISLVGSHPKIVGIKCNNTDSGRIFMDKVRFLIDRYDSNLLDGIRRYPTKLNLKNGSKIILFNGLMIGHQYNDLIFDNYKLNDKEYQDILLGLVSPSKIIIGYSNETLVNPTPNIFIENFSIEQRFKFVSFFG